MSCKSDVYKKFRLCENKGFLLPNPLTSLPKYFDVWESAKIIWKWSPDQVRRFVDTMPLLDHEKLSETRELYLAHLELTTLSNAYIWCKGEDFVPQRLPKAVSIPLVQVSLRSGLKPILGHADGVLHNCILQSDGSFKIIAGKWIPEEDNDYFYTVTAMMEKRFAAGISSMVDFMLSSKSEEDCCEVLKQLSSIIKSMEQLFETMRQKVDPDVFYQKLRPYYAGYSGKAWKQLGGVIFDGVSETPQTYRGGSEAQSSIFASLDAFLGIHYTEKSTCFLKEMIDYMLPSHQAFIDWLTTSNIREKAQHANAITRRSYNDCVQSLVSFRSKHIQIVTQYIVVPSKSSAAAEKRYRSLDTEGTGGTQMMCFLKAVRDTTQAHVLDE